MSVGVTVRKIEGEYARAIVLDARAAEGECPYCRQFSFASEYPVERWYGTEILSHNPKHVDLSRLQEGANLLWNHSMDQVLGVLEEARVSSKKSYCRAHFDEEDENALKRLSQVDRGIIKNVSCRYEVLEWTEEKSKPGKPPVVTATRWQPIEVSLVSVPADPTVGIGRAKEAVIWVPAAYHDSVKPENSGARHMGDEDKNTGTLERETAQAAKAERERIRSIQAMVGHWGRKDPKKAEELAEKLIEEGFGETEARTKFAELILNAPENTQPVGALNPQDLTLGLSKKEERSYSILRAVKAFVEKDWSKAGLELEASRAIADKLGQDPKGFYVPFKDLRVDEVAAQQQRALITTSTTGQIIATELRPEMFVDALRNRLILVMAGARYISDCVGNIDIPRQTGSGTAFWVSEGSAPIDTNLTTDLLQARPKTVGALSSITRLMMLQSTPDIENLVRSDILAILALEIDRAGINGSGAAGQPRGILQTVGIGSVAIGANGGPITYDHVIDLETMVATANADSNSMAYLTNAKCVGKLKKLKDTTNAPLWINRVAGLTPGTPGELNGYPVYRSNQVPGNLTKGTGTNLDAVIFGDFGNLMFFEWGDLDILPNPYGSGYAAGNIELRALKTVDCQVRRAVYFAAITDVA